MHMTDIDSIYVNQFNDDISIRRSCNYKKYCKPIPQILLLLGIFLILATNIYTSVLLQLFLLNMKTLFSKLNVAELTALYRNISHNTQIMCENDFRIKNRDVLCYHG